MSIHKQTSHYTCICLSEREGEMEDEGRGNGTNGPCRGNPDSPCLKSSTGSSNHNNKEQDRFLPIANVGRIMKKVIPGNGKTSKDAKETVQECVSEFISFVTGEASDKCLREKRKTINGDDIIWAITILGFEDYVATLKLYLIRYREIEGEKLSLPKQQRIDHQRLPQQHQQEQEPEPEPDITPQYTRTVYSSAPLVSQPSLITPDLIFPLYFSPSSIQKQLHQPVQVDSIQQ